MGGLRFFARLSAGISGCMNEAASGSASFTTFARQVQLPPLTARYEECQCSMKKDIDKRHCILKNANNRSGGENAQRIERPSAASRVA
jgi:hypothetical protein